MCLIKRLFETNVLRLKVLFSMHPIMPLHAMANGMWGGLALPPSFGLSWVERKVLSKGRVNMSVRRVT